MANTNQGLRQESVRAVTGTTLAYNGDWIALFRLSSIDTGSFDGDLLAWINLQLGVTYTNLSGAMVAYAVSQGFSNWGSMGTFTPGGAGGGASLITGETNAMGIDFTYHTDITKQHYISDLTTPANNYNSYPQGKLTYTSPSVKMTRQSDGVWRYVNHNLCLQSQTFDSATWSNSNSTETANTQTAPDGTVTADTLTSSAANDANGIFQFVTISASTTYTASVYVKKGNHRYVCLSIAGDNAKWAVGVFDLDGGGSAATQTDGTGGTVISTSQVASANGWYRITVTGSVTGAAGPALLMGFAGAATGNTFLAGYGFTSFTGAGTETIYLWGAQVKRYPVNDAGGYTYATGYLATTSSAVYDLPYEWSAALASQGILIEEARTNSHTYSQQIDNAVWTKEAVTISANATTAPDGTTTADKVAEDNNTTNHQIYQQISGTAAAWTWSIFVKAAERTFVTPCFTLDGATNHGVCFNLSTGAAGTTTGTITSSSITAEANGWYRISITKTLTSASWYLVINLATVDGAPKQIYMGTTGNGAYLWGSQPELGAFATSPINTVAATVTRAADNISLATSAMPFSTTVGTLIAAALIPYPSLGGTKIIVDLDDGTANERISMEILTSLALETQVVDGGTTVANLAPGNITANTAFKVGVAYALNDVASVLNGGTPQTDASASMPTCTLLQIGAFAAGVAIPLNGYLRQVTYLKRRATNVELQTKTT